MGTAYSMHGEKTNAYRILVGKPEGNRPPYLELCSEDIIKLDLREIGWGVIDWTDLLRIGISGGLYSKR
jgi:hypothetical protein